MKATDLVVDLSALAGPLKHWLPGRRWFGGKGRRIRGVSFADRAMLTAADTPVILALVDVAYEDEEPERYFLPLRPSEVGEGALGGFEDALGDELACLALLRAVADAEELPSAAGGAIRFERGPGFELLHGGLGPTSARPLGVEQSNTSVVFGDTIIMKAFRRIPDGPNPDLELPRFLETRTDFRQLPRLAGAIEYRGPQGSSGSLAVLQEFVTSEGDGWSYTLRALAAGELREDSLYLEELRALGRVTAELHLALASDGNEPDFAPDPVGVDDLRAWRDGVADRVRRAGAALTRAVSDLEPETRERAERVLAGERRLMERSDVLTGLRPAGLSKTRFHGDYHLGQVLKTGRGWLVLDFEGEPLRPLAERRARHCPLKDVAGMLRSLSYARQAALRDPGGAGPAPNAQALAEWERLARTAYLEAYFERAGREAVFLPQDETATRTLLEAFELEKAAYELEYELNNRPDWVGLPLSYLAAAVNTG